MRQRPNSGMTRANRNYGPSETGADIRLLVLDIDGTIMDKSGHIRDAVGHAIHSAQRQGVAVAVATGRLFQSALDAYDSIGSTLPLTCFEGALIQEPQTGLVHRHWYLDSRVAAQILDYAERLNAGCRLSIHFHIQDKLYVSNLNDASMKFLERSPVEPILVGDLRPLLHRPATKVMVLSEDARVIARLSTGLKNLLCRTQIKQDQSISLLEAFHPAVNKRLAVSYLAEGLLALRPENVIAIGNDFNDVELLQYAGIGVAMGDAHPAVKAFADWVTTTVEEDGVAQAVERWILRARSKSAKTYL